MLDTLFGLIFAVLSTFGLSDAPPNAPAYLLDPAKSESTETPPEVMDSEMDHTEESGGFPVIVG